ncbi:unnamed protein product [Mesocestoides corti]|uniref:Uncharacterized protein n=1 Tax=Mesocestoides corti TaxID=53468 RepID=A0A0R3U724_MESCO|nr:unnamed protein product [Mesocestoides corti]
MSEYVCEQFVRRYLMSHNYTRTWAILDIESSSDNLNGCVISRTLILISTFAIKCNEVVSINSFFNNQKIFDLSSPSWAQWLGMLLFEPQKHHFFGRYFTKTWVDVLFTSLSNFLCVLFSSLPILSKLEDQEDIAPVGFIKTGKAATPAFRSSEIRNVGYEAPDARTPAAH